MKTKYGVAVLLTALSASVLFVSPRAHAQVFVVNTDDDLREDRCDARHCTLREAIQAANRLPRGAEIRFALPVFPHRIDLRRPLPALRGGVVIDGASQPGAECPLPIVHINGAAIPGEDPVNGLEVRGDRNRVRGLAITGFSGHGIVVDGNENSLQCLFVGVDPAGSEAQGNQGHGIAVVGGHSNRIGGPISADGNLLSANGGEGLYVEDALNTYLAYNGIGIDILGYPRLPNGNADMPPIKPLPGPPNIRNPRAVAAIADAATRHATAINEQYGRALEDSGLFEKYRRLLAGRGRGDPSPADLPELTAALAEQPDLYVAFIAEATAVMQEARRDAAVQLDRLDQTVRRSLPGFGRNTPPPAQAQLDILNYTLAVYSPGDYVTSGPPSDIAIVETDIGPPISNPLSWHSLMTWGPTFFDQQDYYYSHNGLGVKPYPDALTSFPGISYLSHVCVNDADLPLMPACHWPLIYDLLPFSVQLLWQSATLTPQEIEDIVEENGYKLELWVNNQKLIQGSPPVLFLNGYLNTTTPLGQGYYVASVPGGASPKVCPPGRNCLATVVLAQKVLASIPKPWVFEIKVKKLELIPVAVDELGNPITAHSATVIAQASRIVQANPDTGSENWFTEALYETFQHPRCAHCHSFGTFENIAAHHSPSDPQAFMSQVNLHLEPSLYVPGAHVMACNNCHGLALKDPNGTAFIEVEWRVPYHDLDVNWSQKSAAQICARVKSNLSTWLHRYQHFHGDSRLFWATTSGILPDGTTKPTAPPHDWDEFLRRVDHWNNFGTPCP